MLLISLTENCGQNGSEQTSLAIATSLPSTSFTPDTLLIVDKVTKQSFVLEFDQFQWDK